MPASQPHAPPAMTHNLADNTGSPRRQDIEIASPANDALLAAWYYPAPSGKRGPVVVCGHGLGGTREQGLDDYCAVFQEAGYAAIAFDYAGFGASKGNAPRQVLDWWKQQRDWDAVLSYVKQHELVDPARIAIFGTSFGGGHVIEVAARHKEVAAVISQCPFTDGIRSALCVTPLASVQLLGRALRDYFFWSEREHLSVPCAGKPGEVALMNSHDAWDGYLALVPEEKREAFETVNGLVAARLVLQMPFLRPGAKTSQVKAPIYFAICGSDSVCPPNATRAYAKKAPRAEITDYEDMSHFSIYKGEHFKRATADYLRFLKKHLVTQASL
ncbi:alpha/beta-hydrolase, partial [Tilletiopsis washingtonensis]